MKVHMVLYSLIDHRDLKDPWEREETKEIQGKEVRKVTVALLDCKAFQDQL